MPKNSLGLLGISMSHIHTIKNKGDIMRTLEYNDWYKLEELVVHHAGDKATEILSIFKQVPSDIWVTEDILGLVAYIHLPIEVDMIITMQWDNRFNKTHWKKLITLVDNREKEVHINSNPNNKTIARLVKSHGGYWLYNDAIFPKKG
jgi:histidinol phosphatase-like PHP family hydrolase